ncbi:MAG TPA: VOC family protein [Pseudonocardiaceae bacterium]
MTESTSFSPGLVCWIDASSTDPARSRDFYAGLFGWTYHIDPDPDRGYYTTALCNGQPVAGLSGVAVQEGQPVAWRLYLASANITHTAELLTGWGGQLLYGPADAGAETSVMIGADPTGGVIGFWEPGPPWPFHTADPGALIWAELNTWDGATADQFYANLFGYQQDQIGDGQNVDYTSWSRGGSTMLARIQMNEDWASGVASHWLPHFTVHPEVGTDAMVNRVIELGGRVDVFPYDTELGRIARVADPCGASFALVDPAARIPEPIRCIADEAGRLSS